MASWRSEVQVALRWMKVRRQLRWKGGAVAALRMRVRRRRGEKRHGGSAEDEEWQLRGREMTWVRSRW